VSVTRRHLRKTGFIHNKAYVYHHHKYGDHLHSQDDGIAWILSGIKAPALRADSGVAAGQKLYHVLLQSATESAGCMRDGRIGVVITLARKGSRLKDCISAPNHWLSITDLSQKVGVQ
jgi:hypothetical protein